MSLVAKKSSKTQNIVEDTTNQDPTDWISKLEICVIHFMGTILFGQLKERGPVENAPLHDANELLNQISQIINTLASNIITQSQPMLASLLFMNNKDFSQIENEKLLKHVKNFETSQLAMSYKKLNVVKRLDKLIDFVHKTREFSELSTSSKEHIHPSTSLVGPSTKYSNQIKSVENSKLQKKQIIPEYLRGSELIFPSPEDSVTTIYKKIHAHNHTLMCNHGIPCSDEQLLQNQFYPLKSTVNSPTDKQNKFEVNLALISQEEITNPERPMHSIIPSRESSFWRKETSAEQKQADYLFNESQVSQNPESYLQNEIEQPSELQNPYKEQRSESKQLQPQQSQLHSQFQPVKNNSITEPEQISEEQYSPDQMHHDQIKRTSQTQQTRLQSIHTTQMQEQVGGNKETNYSPNQQQLLSEQMALRQACLNRNQVQQRLLQLSPKPPCRQHQPIQPCNQKKMRQDCRQQCMQKSQFSQQPFQYPQRQFEYPQQPPQYIQQQSQYPQQPPQYIQQQSQYRQHPPQYLQQQSQYPQQPSQYLQQQSEYSQQPPQYLQQLPQQMPYQQYTTSLQQQSPYNQQEQQYDQLQSERAHIDAPYFQEYYSTGQPQLICRPLNCKIPVQNLGFKQSSKCNPQPTYKQAQSGQCHPPLPPCKTRTKKCKKQQSKQCSQQAPLQYISTQQTNSSRVQEQPCGKTKSRRKTSSKARKPSCGKKVPNCNKLEQFYCEETSAQPQQGSLPFQEFDPQNLILQTQQQEIRGGLVQQFNSSAMNPVQPAPNFQQPGWSRLNAESSSMGQHPLFIREMVNPFGSKSGEQIYYSPMTLSLFVNENHDKKITKSCRKSGPSNSRQYSKSLPQKKKVPRNTALCKPTYTPAKGTCYPSSRNQTGYIYDQPRPTYRTKSTKKYPTYPPKPKSKFFTPDGKSEYDQFVNNKNYKPQLHQAFQNAESHAPSQEFVGIENSKRSINVESPSLTKSQDTFGVRNIPSEQIQVKSSIHNEVLANVSSNRMEPEVGNNPAYPVTRKQNSSMLQNNQLEPSEIVFDADIELLPPISLRDSSQDLTPEDLRQFTVPYIYPIPIPADQLGPEDDFPAFTFSELAQNYIPDSADDPVRQLIVEYFTIDPKNISESARRSLAEKEGRTFQAGENPMQEEVFGEQQTNIPNGSTDIFHSGTINTSQGGLNSYTGGSMKLEPANIQQGVPVRSGFNSVTLLGVNQYEAKTSKPLVDQYNQVSAQGQTIPRQSATYSGPNGISTKTDQQYGQQAQGHGEIQLANQHNSEKRVNENRKIQRESHEKDMSATIPPHIDGLEDSGSQVSLAIGNSTNAAYRSFLAEDRCRGCPIPIKPPHLRRRRAKLRKCIHRKECDGGSNRTKKTIACPMEVIGIGLEEVPSITQFDQRRELNIPGMKLFDMDRKCGKIPESSQLKPVCPREPLCNKPGFEHLHKPKAPVPSSLRFGEQANLSQSYQPDENNFESEQHQGSSNGAKQVSQPPGKHSRNNRTSLKPSYGKTNHGRQKKKSKSPTDLIARRVRDIACSTSDICDPLVHEPQNNSNCEFRCEIVPIEKLNKSHYKSKTKIPSKIGHKKKSIPTKERHDCSKCPKYCIKRSKICKDKGVSLHDELNQETEVEPGFDKENEELGMGEKNEEEGEPAEAEPEPEPEPEPDPDLGDLLLLPPIVPLTPSTAYIQPFPISSNITMSPFEFELRPSVMLARSSLHIDQIDVPSPPPEKHIPENSTVEKPPQSKPSEQIPPSNLKDNISKRATPIFKFKQLPPEVPSQCLINQETCGKPGYCRKQIQDCEMLPFPNGQPYGVQPSVKSYPKTLPFSKRPTSSVRKQTAYRQSYRPLPPTSGKQTRMKNFKCSEQQHKIQKLEQQLDCMQQMWEKQQNSGQMFQPRLQHENQETMLKELMRNTNFQNRTTEHLMNQTLEQQQAQNTQQLQTPNMMMQNNAILQDVRQLTLTQQERQWRLQQEQQMRKGEFEWQKPGRWQAQDQQDLGLFGNIDEQTRLMQQIHSQRGPQPDRGGKEWRPQDQQFGPAQQMKLQQGQQFRPDQGLRSQKSQQFGPMGNGQERLTPQQSQQFGSMGNGQDRLRPQQSQQFRPEQELQSQQSQQFGSMGNGQDRLRPHQNQQLGQMGNGQERLKPQNSQQFRPAPIEEQHLRSQQSQQFGPMGNEQERLKPQNSQQFRPAPIREQQMRSQQSQQFGPTGNGQEMLRSQKSQQFGPVGNGQEMLRSQKSQQFGPMGNGQEMSRSQKNQQFGPMDNGQEMLRSQKSQQFGPMSNGQEILRSQQSRKFPPMRIQEQQLRSQQNQQFTPVTTQEQQSRSQQNQQFAPMTIQEQQFRSQQNQQSELIGIQGQQFRPQQNQQFGSIGLQEQFQPQQNQQFGSNGLQEQQYRAQQNQQFGSNGLQEQQYRAQQNQQFRSNGLQEQQFRPQQNQQFVSTGMQRQLLQPQQIQQSGSRGLVKQQSRIPIQSQRLPLQEIKEQLPILQSQTAITHTEQLPLPPPPYAGQLSEPYQVSQYTEQGVQGQFSSNNYKCIPVNGLQEHGPLRRGPIKLSLYLQKDPGAKNNCKPIKSTCAPVYKAVLPLNNKQYPVKCLPVTPKPKGARRSKCNDLA